MTIKRRVVSSLVLASSVVVCLSVTPLSSVTSAKTITIVNYYRGWGSLIDIYKDVQDAFEKAHPDIKVKLMNAPRPEEYFTRLELMLTAGNAPDLVLMESTQWARYGQNGLMTDLTSLLKNDSTVKLDDYHKAALDLWSYKGKVYGLPCDVAVMQLAYNKDMFDKAGVSYPKASWDQEDFINTTKRLTIDRNGDGKPDQYGIDNPWVTAMWEQVVYGFGGNIADKREKASRCLLNQPEALDGIGFMSDLLRKHRVAGGEFYSGNAAMGPIGHWNIPDFTKLLKFKWDVAEIPTFKRKAVIGYGSAYMIPANSKHKKEAWELLKWYAGPVGSKMLAKANFMTPALKSTSESDIFLKNSPPANKHAFLKAFDYIVPRVVTTQWDRIVAAFQPEYTKVLAGKKSPKEAMDTVAPFVTKLFTRDR